MFGFLGGDDPLVAEQAGKDGASSDPHEALPDVGAALTGLWGAVSSAVRQTAVEVVSSVQATDWKSELATFTHEVEAEAVRAVQHAGTRLSESGSSPLAAAAAAASSSAAAAAAGRASSGSGTQAAPRAPRPAALGALAEFGKQLMHGTREVFDTVTDLVEGELSAAARDVPRFAAGAGSGGGAGRGSSARLASRQRAAARYSRFDAEVAAMQRDSATYCDEPEDGADYAAWRAGFDLAAAQPEIDQLLACNAFMAELQGRIVPLLVERADFWTRYFFRLHQLAAREEQRQQLAARAKQLGELEELAGWDDDDSPKHVPAATTAAAADEEAAGKEEAPTERQQQQQQQQQPAPGPREPQAPGRGAPRSRLRQQGALQPEQQQEAAGAAAAAVSGLQLQQLEAVPEHAVPVAAAGPAPGKVAHVVRMHSDDPGSLPSTPVRVGSDISDAALATDTLSEASSAAAAASGQGAAWTLVTGNKAPPPQQQQQQQQQLPPAPAAGLAAKKQAGGAALAGPADSTAASASDEDNDWGDDEPPVCAGVTATGAASASAAGAEDDWDSWA